eukprot:TRINITY_DN1656_c0_g1_i2.p1 TRINITY_DN1656_c0_g1~~TRINITY_DN1656_c0_g1_i2.p1  ORF type:complete len:139 (+),score=12.67 TRINITY_DN1656_c0_g1_i2:40-417(+)
MGVADKTIQQPEYQQTRIQEPEDSSEFTSELTFNDACRNQNANQIRSLLGAGYKSNINDKDGRGWVPLIYAIRFNTFEVVECLIKIGVSLDVVDSRGNNPLHLASRLGFFQYFLLELLLWQWLIF